MSSKAVFVDRDNTLIEDPGYLSDPSAIKLLPGVELAVKSLAQAGYKVVVVTNQAGVARGLLTEEALERIHAEMRRQLAEHGAHLDGIYYCPFHPEGTVEEYAKDSDLRKPKPGMLLKAAKELDIDLSGSWMVGDGARDIEAGQRAGCRTVRVRLRPAHHGAGGVAEEDEDVQADYTVRNLVDAARVILRSPQQAEVAAAGRAPSARAAAAARIMAEQPAVATELGQASALAPEHEQAPAEPPPAELPAETEAFQQEVLRCLRQIADQGAAGQFSLVKLFAGIIQVVAGLGVALALFDALAGRIQEATLWALIAICLQLMSLTMFFGVKRRP